MGFAGAGVLVRGAIIGYEELTVVFESAHYFLTLAIKYISHQEVKHG